MIKEIIAWILGLFKKPTGVLPIKVMGSDEVFVPSISMDGDWKPYMSAPYDSQYFTFDTLACVSFSGIHTIEGLLNYYYKNNLLPKPLMDFISNPISGFINEQGFIELSVRFTAKMAGTTKQGLSMDAFWQSVNRDGIVPKKIYNDPSGNFTYDEYFAPIPQKIINLGASFAKLFKWNWTVISNNEWNSPNLFKLREALTHSPIHWAGSSCPKDFAGIQRPCGSKVYAHARTIYKIDDFIECLDQYDPFLVKNSSDYPIPCAIISNLKLE